MDNNNQTNNNSEGNNSPPSNTNTENPPTTTNDNPPPTTNTNENQGGNGTENQNQQNEMKQKIEDWIRKNDYRELKCVSIEDFLINFSIGPLNSLFQVGVDQDWKPMFLFSEAEILQEFVPGINMWLEQNTDSSIFDFLNYFGQQFQEARDHIINQLDTGKNVEDSPFSKIIENLKNQMNNNNENGTNNNTNPINFNNFTIPQVPNQRNDNIDQNGEGEEVKEEEIETVVPTDEDWENTIIPECRRHLYNQGKMSYEVEEWIRIVQVHLKNGDVMRALSSVRNTIFERAQVPNVLKKFLPKPQDYWNQNRVNELNTRYNTSGGSEEAIKYLLSQVEALEKLDTRKDNGFIAKPFGKNLFHWFVRIFGSNIDSESHLGMQLMEWSLANSNINDTNSRIQPKDIMVEILFPSDFPKESPLIRLVSPRFIDTNLEVSSGYEKGLNVSQVIQDLVEWNKDLGIVEMIGEIKRHLGDKRVDLEAGDVDLSTVGDFWKKFMCISPGVYGKSEIENGGRIVLPASSLETLYTDHWRDNSLNRSDGGSPMIFEISSKNKRSFCGVVEFSAEEGTCCVPKWMMKNLDVDDGSEIFVRRVSLPKGTFLRLQPHDAKFAEVKDTKAMLEWVLSRYTAVGCGDNLVVNYRNREYNFNVVTTKPGHAIRIIGCDIPVDFAPPLSGESLPESLLPVTVPQDQLGKQDQIDEQPVKKDEPKEPVGQTTGGYVGSDYKQCENCRTPVPPSKYDLHYATCVRMNWLCIQCGQVVQKAFKEQHLKEAHVTVFCECGEEMDKSVLNSHKERDCPNRITKCSFCPLDMPYIEIWSHEQMCGAKTNRCDKCNQWIKNRDWDHHYEFCGVKDAPPSPSPVEIDPVNVPKPTFGDFIPCPYCSSPFVEWDELQIHILITHPKEAENMQDQGGFQEGDNNNGNDNQNNNNNMDTTNDK